MSDEEYREGEEYADPDQGYGMEGGYQYEEPPYHENYQNEGYDAQGDYGNDEYAQGDYGNDNNYQQQDYNQEDYSNNENAYNQDYSNQDYSNQDYGGGYGDGYGNQQAEGDYEEEPQEEEPQEEEVPEYEPEEEEQEEGDPEPEENYDYDDDYGKEEYEDHNTVQIEGDPEDWTEEDICAAGDTNAIERLEESGRTLAASADDSSGCGGGFKLGSMFKGAMDGFGGGNISDIVGSISQMTGGGGGGGGALTNIFSSGGFGNIAEKLIANAAHRFLGVDESTGAIIGAIAGNIIFQMGGKGNSLGSIGKIVLDNIISGKFKRKVDPWVSPVPGTHSFGLNFLQERDRCLRDKVLFEDPEFPANDRALYFKTPPEQHVEWKRPGELVSDPQLIVEGHSRFDVKQGALGDCWLLAAVANLTLRDELFYRVVPPDQSFTENYAGIFHFQFWRYGKWIDVVIDDKLPTVNGQLIYMHSREHNEFWSALIEKAYAKLYGSYENLEGGTTVEALEDFTGGLSEFFDLKKTPKETVLAMMVRGFQMGSLFGCSIQADPTVKEAVQSNGLVRGHAYSITALQTVSTYRGEIVLVRIRNPWGNSKEWNGTWSDNAPEWESISGEEKQKLNLSFAKDGEFWMAFDDFFKEYEDMEICNLSAEVMNEISAMTGVDAQSVANTAQWIEKMDDGRWSEDEGTAGGCANYPNSYYRNPQFGSYFTVTNESVEHDGKCTVICAVLQKYRREMRTQGKDSLPIGFSVYEAPDSSAPLDMHFLRNHKALARVPVFINMREVTVRFRVPPGNYVILPCTFEPGQDGEFLIRVYANGQVNMQKLQG